MKRSTALYALSLAGFLIVLKTLEYRYWLSNVTTEFYIGLIALLFTVLGLWIGSKLRTIRQGPQVATVPVAIRRSGEELGISPRESEVLRLIAAGHSNQEIADTLYLSINTVKKHTSMILRKLEAERRTQAIEKARRLGLLD